MNDNSYEHDFTAQDILAAIGFEAQRIVAGVVQHAAGTPFPDPVMIQQMIDHMGSLNKTLLQFRVLLMSPPGEGGDMSAAGGMSVKLDN